MGLPRPPEDQCLVCRDIVTVPHDKLDKTMEREGNLITDFRKLCRFLRLDFAKSLKRLTPILARNTGDCWRSFLCPQCLAEMMSLSSYYDSIDRIQRNIDIIIRSFQELVRKADMVGGSGSPSTTTSYNTKPPSFKGRRKRQRLSKYSEPQVPVAEVDYTKFGEIFRTLVTQVVTRKPPPVVLSDEAAALSQLYQQAEEESDRQELLNLAKTSSETENLEESDDLLVVCRSTESDEQGEGSDNPEQEGSTEDITSAADNYSPKETTPVQNLNYNNESPVNCEEGEIENVGCASEIEMECDDSNDLGLIIVNTSGSQVVNDSGISLIQFEEDAAVTGRTASNEPQGIANPQPSNCPPPESPPCIVIDDDDDNNVISTGSTSASNDDDILIVKDVNRTSTCPPAPAQISILQGEPPEGSNVYVYHLHYNEPGRGEPETAVAAPPPSRDPKPAEYKNTYSCRYCDISFGTAPSYYFHRRDSHPTQSKALNIPFHEQRVGHGNFVTRSNLFKVCPICGEFNRQKGNAVVHLKEHMLSHDSLTASFTTISGEYISPAVKDPFKCPHCPQQFHLELNLELHQICYHDSNLIERKCDQCCHSFATTPLLVRHLKEAHSTTVIHSCQSCPLVFSSLEGCLKHVQIHAASKRLVCLQCPQIFESSKDLYSHFHSCHHEFLTPLHCKTCLRVFPSKPEAQAHERRSHRDKQKPSVNVGRNT